MKKLINIINFRNLGIFLLISMYIFSGINKIFNFNNISKELKNKFENKFNVNLPINFYKFTMVLVILLLVVGSLLLLIIDNINIIYKLQILKLLCVLFISFTGLATYLYHYPPIGNEVYSFMKNISIIGGFLILLSSYNLK